MSWFPGKVIHEKIHNRNSGEFGASKTTETPTQEVDAPSEVDEDKDEEGVMNLLALTHKKFTDLGIEGNINLSYTFGIFNSAVSCDVILDESQTAEIALENIPLDSKVVERLSTLERLVLPAVDATIRKLQRRAISWQGSRLQKNAILSNGVTVRTPFIGLISISVTLSASVDSLIKSASKQAAMKADAASKATG